MYRTEIVGETRFEGVLDDNNPTFEILCPPDAKAGHVLIMHIRLQSGTATAFFSHADWKMISDEYSLNSTTRRVNQTLRHVVTQAEEDALALDPNSVSWTFARPPSTGDMTGRTNASIIALAPVVDDIVVATGDTASSEVYGGHSISSPPDHTFTMVAAACEMVSGQNPAPVNASFTGWDELEGGILDTVGPNNSRTLLRIVTAEDVGSSTGTLDFEWVGDAVAPYEWGTTIRWQVNPEGGAPVAVTTVLELPSSTYTISEMEQDIANGKRVFWAHRGGSSGVPWGEMTLLGYRNAAYHGAKVLEVSVWPTADEAPVWIMSHDANLERVTGESGYTIGDSLAEELLGLPVLGGGVVGRLEDVLNEFGDLVLLVDNKAGTHADELYALLKTVPGWQEHIIYKVDGFRPIGAEGGVQDASGEGFKVATYFYHNSTMSGTQSVENKMVYTDYPGLEWDADDKAESGELDWATMVTLADGKPIWAHILTSQEQVETAANKGAEIFQCADVLALIPQAVPGAYSLPVRPYQLDRKLDELEAGIDTSVSATVAAAVDSAVSTARVQDRADDVFNALSIAAPSFDRPVATWSNDETTSAYSSPQEYFPAVVGLGSKTTGWDGRTSPSQSNFRLGPAVYETAQGANQDYMLMGSLKPEGDASFCRWPITVDFVTSSDVATFEVTTYATAAQTPIVVWVGGQYAGTFYNPAGMSPGRKVRFDFEGPSSRWIRLQILGEIGFRAIRVENGKSISLPPDTVTRRIAVIGDSWVHGAGSPVAAGTLRGTSPVDTYVWPLLRAMGAQEIIQAGIGGTGFIAGTNGMDPANYITRVSGVLAMSPDALLLKGSGSDPFDGSGYGTLQEIYDDMKSHVEAVLTATDSITERYVQTIPRLGYEAANAAIRDAVTEHGEGVILIDQEGLFNGTGNAIDGGTGLRGKFFLDDNVHITYNGHDFLARQTFRQIFPYLP